MKLNKSILAGLATVALASGAFAQVTVTITGSTAFRPIAFDRAASLYDAGYAAYTNGANQVTYVGTMSGSTSLGAAQVTTYLSFTGSGAGVLAVKNQTPVTVTTGTNSSGVLQTTTKTPDLAFSDVFPATAGVTSGVDDNNIVGVIPFVWIKNKASLSHFTNITRDQADYLASSSGFFTEAYFSGNPANSQTVYLIGRDSSSGTYLTTFADIAFTGAPLEWTTNFNNTQLVTTNLNGTPFVGYSSGSIVRGVTAAYAGAIAYIGVSDANAVTNNVDICSYNGVPYTAANVQNGLYGMWGYEHMINRTGGLSPNQAIVFNALVGKVTDPTFQTTNPLYTAAFVDQANMLVSRQSDGGPIAQ